jgi:hypothetical protein
MAGLLAAGGAACGSHEYPEIRVRLVVDGAARTSWLCMVAVDGMFIRREPDGEVSNAQWTRPLDLAARSRAVAVLGPRLGEVLRRGTGVLTSRPLTVSYDG